MPCTCLPCTCMPCTDTSYACMPCTGMSCTHLTALAPLAPGGRPPSKGGLTKDEKSLLCAEFRCDEACYAEMKKHIDRPESWSNKKLIDFQKNRRIAEGRRIAVAETGLGGPKGRGREFQPAATPRFDPSDIVGKKTKKYFRGFGTFIGKIVSVSAEGWYSIRYADGDVEEVVRVTAQKGIKRYEEGSQ